MNHHNRRKLASMRRVKQFFLDHFSLLANAAAASEHAALSEVILRMQDVAEDQLSGIGTRSGAVAERLTIERRLRDLMGSLARAAKVLDRATFPDVAATMRMSGIDSFEELLVRAKLFCSTLEPIAGVFISLGAAPTVIAELNTLIEALTTAGNRKCSGLDLQIGATKGIEVAAREGMQHIRKLDAIVRLMCQADLVLLAQWKAAKRVERRGAPGAETAAIPRADSIESESRDVRSENDFGAEAKILPGVSTDRASVREDGHFVEPRLPSGSVAYHPLYNRGVPRFEIALPVTASACAGMEGPCWKLSS